MASNSFTGKAHYTTAKFGDLKSEFEECELTTQFFDESVAPCVAESPFKILMRYERNMG
jgi:hypothetical protein